MLIIWSLYLVGFYLIYLLNKESRAHSRIKQELKLIGVLGDGLPDRSKIYYDRLTGRECQRCKAGEITIRRRFKVVPTDNEGTVIKNLARVYWCNSCNFRTTTLETID